VGDVRDMLDCEVGGFERLMETFIGASVRCTARKSTVKQATVMDLESEQV
jgi:hypothetical protein